MAVKVELMPIACHKVPNTPPSNAKPRILPAWKRVKVFLSLNVSCPTVAESERTSQPTTARQLETEAIRPIRKLVVGVTFPQKPKLRMPDFWRRKNRPRTIRPRGIARQIVPSCCGFSLNFSCAKL